MAFPDNKELLQLKQQLSEHYIAISKMYVRMSKTIDAHSLDILQSGIDGRLTMANDLRKEIKSKQQEMFKEWQQAKEDSRPKFE